MADTARLIELSIRRTQDGTPGYKLENPFGQTIQVLPKPPGFRAALVFEWEGAMPDEIAALVERARLAGISRDR